MYIYVIILLAAILLSLARDERDFLSKQQTSVINGIFVVLIFLSHSKQYTGYGNSFLDNVYKDSFIVHSQLVVSTFLTFSGFGVMRSYITKKENYLKGYIIKYNFPNQ